MRAFASLVLLAASPAFSATLLGAPASACAALVTEGLVTRGWKDTTGGEYWCSSPYKELGKTTSASLANNLAFYVARNSGTVERLWLKLNVNQKGQGAAAQKELARTAGILSQKATGQPLPAAAVKAIAAGKPIETNVGGAKLSVTRDNWTTGMGYELKVSFQ